MAVRAILFIDGSNWYHGLKNLNVQDRGRLDYVKISQKLLKHRQWLETRYYIGRVPQTGDLKLYADQRRFLDKLTRSDPRITVHLGRIEPRRTVNQVARNLKAYLSTLRTRIDIRVYRDLMKIASDHQKTTVLVEKAVDVLLAVDLVVMAERDDFDAAYLLSADGDYTPAVKHVRELGKRVYAAAGSKGARLAAAVNSFIPLSTNWFDDCYD